MRSSRVLSMLCVRWAALVRWQTAAVRRDGCSGVGRRPRSVVSRVACGSAPSVMFRSKETFGHPVHCDRLASDRVRLDRLRGCGRTAGRTARPCYERTNERTKGIAFFWIEEERRRRRSISRLSGRKNTKIIITRREKIGGPREYHQTTRNSIPRWNQMSWWA